MFKKQFKASLKTKKFQVLSNIQVMRMTRNDLVTPKRNYNRGMKGYLSTSRFLFDPLFHPQFRSGFTDCIS